MNRSLKMRKWGVVISCGIVLLIAAAVAVVVALRNCQQPAPPPGVPVVVSPTEVRVKAVERKSATVIQKGPTLFYNSNPMKGNK